MKYFRQIRHKLNIADKPSGKIDILYALDDGRILEWHRSLLRRWVDNGNNVDAYKAMYQGTSPVAAFVNRVVTDREWAALKSGDSMMKVGVIVPMDDTIEVE